MKDLTTNRLRVIPLTCAQLELLLLGQNKLDEALDLRPCGVPLDEHVKQALAELHAGCAAHPASYLWYTNWQIVLTGENISIGSIAFMGRPANGSVEVGYGINPEYRGCGFAAEALSAMLRWAFNHPFVLSVTAQTDWENTPSQRVLETCGFTQIGTGEEGLLWEKKHTRKV